MKKRDVSIILFYNDDGNILIQIKPEYKEGNLHRFFGGGIEENESSEEALLREIREELTIELKDYIFFKEYQHKNQKVQKDVHKFMYLAKIPSENLIVEEGESLLTSWNEITSLDFSEGDIEILEDIKKHLKF